MVWAWGAGRENPCKLVSARTVPQFNYHCMLASDCNQTVLVPSVDRMIDTALALQISDELTFYSVHTDLI